MDDVSEGTATPLPEGFRRFEETMFGYAWPCRTGSSRSG